MHAFQKFKQKKKKIEGTIQTSSIEISYFLNKGSQLKNQNPYCFAKHSLNPYQMVELGVWQTAIESVLLSIDDTAYCQERCCHCRKHRETKGDLNASGCSEDLFDLFEDDQSFNTPKKQSPKHQSSLLDIQTPGVASPNENKPKESDQFLKSPQKKPGKTSKTKLSFRNIESPIPTITPEPPMTPKKRQRSPNNFIDGETPSKITKTKSNEQLSQQSGIHVQNDHQGMEGITFLSSPLGPRDPLTPTVTLDPPITPHKRQRSPTHVVEGETPSKINKTKSNDTLDHPPGIPAQQDMEVSSMTNFPPGSNDNLATVTKSGQVTELANAMVGNKNNTANQNIPNKDKNEGLNDKNSQLRGDKNVTRKSLKTKCIERESDPDNFIEVKVSVVGNAPFNACFLHEKKQLVPLLEQKLKINIIRITAISKKHFVLLKVQKENESCFVNQLKKNGEILVSGPNSSSILVTYKWPHRIVIKNVNTCINLKCLKTDIETHNQVKIETITRLGKTTTVKIDIIGKKPPNFLKTPTLGKLAGRIPYEYVEKTKYCLNCLSFLHEKHQCDEAPRCKNCMQPHPTHKCTAHSSEFRCYFCAGHPNHSSRKCPSVHRAAAQYNNREKVNNVVQEVDSIQNTTELSSTNITHQAPADTADLHTTIEHLRQLNKSQEDIITKMRRENVEKHTQSNSK